MSLYTKVGDEGNTRFPDGSMRSKHDPRLCAIGALDELNAHVGLCLAACRPPAAASSVQPAHASAADALARIAACLRPLQADLFVLGAALAQAPNATLRINRDSVHRMERQIDELSAALPPLAHFILPAGSELACRLHVARAVCRRAERELVAARDANHAAGSASPVEPVDLVYINRLSDLLFALARAANHAAGEPETTWQE